MDPWAAAAAYPGEALSYKKRREYALTHDDWSWNLEKWPNFRPFLLDMKPWPDDGQKYELDRIDPAIKAYGPGLCQWLLKPENAGKKSTNKKIVIPFTGEVFTPSEIAVLTGVSVKTRTVYDRMAQDWSPLELREGRPSDFLRDLSAKLAEVHPAPLTPTKGMKPPEKKIDLAVIPRPDDNKFWEDANEGFEYEHQYEDRATLKQLRAEREKRRKAEYEALVYRCKAYKRWLTPSTATGARVLDFRPTSPPKNFLLNIATNMSMNAPTSPLPILSNPCNRSNQTSRPKCKLLPRKAL